MIECQGWEPETLQQNIFSLKERDLEEKLPERYRGERQVWRNCFILHKLPASPEKQNKTKQKFSLYFYVCVLHLSVSAMSTAQRVIFGKVLSITVLTDLQCMSYVSEYIRLMY